MLRRDIMGHESMGEVVEVGSAAKNKLKKSDRIVIPFTIQCGEPDRCKRGNLFVCQWTNREGDPGDTASGHRTAGRFGNTHLTGGDSGAGGDPQQQSGEGSPWQSE
jgi:threonine dehydrogenase-like Zn-dependent dehydrogenase